MNACVCACDARFVKIRRARALLGRVHLVGFVLHDLLSLGQLRLSLLEFRDAIMRVCLGLVFLLGAAEQVHPACSRVAVRAGNRKSEPRAVKFILVCARSRGNACCPVRRALLAPCRAHTDAHRHAPPVYPQASVLSGWVTTLSSSALCRN